MVCVVWIASPLLLNMRLTVLCSYKQYSTALTLLNYGKCRDKNCDPMKLPKGRLL
jgi:hypothetical protein